jgi:hypothetical protein
MDKHLSEMTPLEIWNKIMIAYDSEIYALSQTATEEEVVAKCDEYIKCEWEKCGMQFDLQAVLAIGK